MDRRYIITSVVLLAAMMGVETQLFDIFQQRPAQFQINGISNNYSNSYMVAMTQTTKRPSPQVYRDVNKSPKPVQSVSTTTKPRHTLVDVKHKRQNVTNRNSSKAASHRAQNANPVSSSLQLQDKIVNNGLNNKVREEYNNYESNTRRSTSRHVDRGFGSNSINIHTLDNYNRKTTTEKYIFGDNTRFTTNNKRITTTTKRPSFSYSGDNYENQRTTTRRYQNNYGQTKPNAYNDNAFTTLSPLARPGVKPAVTTNMTPFTNRPVYKPLLINRPLNLRPIDNDAVLFPEDTSVSTSIVKGKDVDSLSVVQKEKYLEIAEKMCEKYKMLDVKRVEAIPLIPSPDPISYNVTSCKQPAPLIIGGQVVTIESYPHMALVGWMKLEGGYSWKCGGSLLSDRFILTAAHCSHQERDYSVVSGPPTAVQLGSSYLDDPGALVERISSVIIHPKYKAPLSYYDLAILKLKNSVTFSEVVKPACLGSLPSAGKSVIATGWGKTETSEQSLELRSVSLPVWDIYDCQRSIGTSKKMPQGPSAESQMCAGEKRGGKDTCQGDSGGPAQIRDGCVWRVVAVTSLGRGCGAADTPGLYAIAQKTFIAYTIFENEVLSYDNRGSESSRGEGNNKDYNHQNNNDRSGTNSHENSVFNNNRNNNRQENNNQQTYSNNNNNNNYGNSNPQINDNNNNYAGEQNSNLNSIIRPQNSNNYNQQVNNVNQQNGLNTANNNRQQYSNNNYDNTYNGHNVYDNGQNNYDNSQKGYDNGQNINDNSHNIYDNVHNTNNNPGTNNIGTVYDNLNKVNEQNKFDNYNNQNNYDVNRETNNNQPTNNGYGNIGYINNYNNPQLNNNNMLWNGNLMRPSIW